MKRIITLGAVFVFALVLSTRFSLGQMTTPPPPAAPAPQTLQEGEEEVENQKNDEMKSKTKSAEEKTKGSMERTKNKSGRQGADGTGVQGQNSKRYRHRGGRPGTKDKGMHRTGQGRT